MWVLCIEQKTKTKITKALRNILILNEVDSINVLAQVDATFKQQMEQLIRNDLTGDMTTPQELEELLGLYKKKQNTFKFSAGQDIVLNTMVQFCKRLIQQDESLVAPVHAEANVDVPQIVERELLSKDEALESLGRSLSIWIRNKRDFDHVRTVRKMLYN